MLNSKNTIFNKSSFVNSKIAIGFVTSKQVRKWYWILILSLSWTWTLNEANLNVNFTKYLKKCERLQVTSNIAKLYTTKKNFSSQVWIYDSYLEIRLCSALIHLQSFHFCMKKCACNTPFIGTISKATLTKIQ